MVCHGLHLFCSWRLLEVAFFYSTVLYGRWRRLGFVFRDGIRSWFYVVEVSKPRTLSARFASLSLLRLLFTEGCKIYSFLQRHIHPQALLARLWWQFLQPHEHVSFGNNFTAYGVLSSPIIVKVPNFVEKEILSDFFRYSARDMTVFVLLFTFSAAVKVFRLMSSTIFVGSGMVSISMSSILILALACSFFSVIFSIPAKPCELSLRKYCCKRWKERDMTSMVPLSNLEDFSKQRWMIRFDSELPHWMG